MSQTSIRAVKDAVAIFRHKERLLAIRNLVRTFAKDPGLLSRRTYAILVPALKFLSTNTKPDPAGVEMMDYERSTASAALLQLKQIMRAKLRADGKEVELEPEAPESPAAPKPFDVWDTAKLPNEEEEDAGIQTDNEKPSI